MKALKIISISLLTIISFALTSGITFAEGEQDGNVFANAFSGTTPCITPDEVKSGKLIQFIEEPFGEAKAKNQGDTSFEIRDCARNTLQYNMDIGNGEKKIVTTSRLTTQCSTNAASIADQNKDGKWNAKFTCQQMQAIISDGGTSFLYGYIGTFYTWAAGLVGIIAVTIIIFSGIQITVSGGEPDAVSNAKSRIIKSLSGIALLFLSALILNTINPNFFTG